jgi:hypothetical protein
MRYLLGTVANLETILTLTTPFRDAAAAPSVPGLRDAMRGYVEALQPDVRRSETPEVAFFTGSDAIPLLADAFGDVDDVAPLSDTAAARVLAQHREATEAIGRDGDLAALFEIGANCVISSAGDGSPASMTSGRALGLLWVNPRPTWSAADVVEAYVHELTHTLLTLDEHRYGHYHSYELLAEPSSHAVSAIRNERRPLNLVFHSVVVAVELLALRRRLPAHHGPFTLHGPSARLSEQARLATASLLETARLERLTTMRFRHLLERIETMLDAPALAA